MLYCIKIWWNEPFFGRNDYFFSPFGAIYKPADRFHHKIHSISEEVRNDCKVIPAILQWQASNDKRSSSFEFKPRNIMKNVNRPVERPHSVLFTSIASMVLHKILFCGREAGIVIVSIVFLLFSILSQECWRYSLPQFSKPVICGARFWTDAVFNWKLIRDQAIHCLFQFHCYEWLFLYLLLFFTKVIAAEPLSPVRCRNAPWLLFLLFFKSFRSSEILQALANIFSSV